MSGFNPIEKFDFGAIFTTERRQIERFPTREAVSKEKEKDDT